MRKLSGSNADRDVNGYRPSRRLSVSAAAAIVIAQLAMVACSGPTAADQARADDLANDPIFNELSHRWVQSNDIVVIPAEAPPDHGGTGLISQAYVRPAPFDADAEYGFAANALERAGWVRVTIDCENMQVRGAKDDGHGSVHIFVRLSDQLPVPGLWAQIDVRSLAEESEEYLAELNQPGDTSCLPGYQSMASEGSDS